MSIFTNKQKSKEYITVAELIDALKDCRPDAEVFTSLFETSGLNKIRKVKNHGNHVQLIRENI